MNNFEMRDCIDGSDAVKMIDLRLSGELGQIFLTSVLQEYGFATNRKS